MKDKFLIGYKSITFLFIIVSLFFMMIQSTFATSMLPFTDVKKEMWFYNDVKYAFEKKLINGKTSSLFAPDENMTYAQAVKLAACMHQLKKEGKVSLKSGNPWYQPYVEYAKKNQLIEGDLPWNEKASRAGYMEIFAQVLPDFEANVNQIADGSIPDVSTLHPNAAAIYKLYRAGVVTGVDNKHNCNPMASIKRSEVSVILVRMMEKTSRKLFAISAEPSGGGGNSGNTADSGGSNAGGTSTAKTPKALKITKQPQDIKDKVGKPAVLSVKVEGGEGALSYQWERTEYGKNAYQISNAIGSDHDTLNAVVEEIAYQYRCVIKDSAGQSLTSETAYVAKSFNPGDLVNHDMINLDVIGNLAQGSDISIVEQPSDVSAFEGADAVLKIKAVGGKGKLRYQWFRAPKDGGPFYQTDYPGNNNRQLFAKVEEKDYLYYCEVSDENNQTLQSDKATVCKISPLLPEPEIMITKQPNPYAVVKDYFDCEIKVEGKEIRYQWQEKDEKGNWKNLWDRERVQGSRKNKLSINYVGGSQIVEEYRCVLTDMFDKQKISDPIKVFANVMKAAPGNRPPVILYANRYYVEDEVREVFFVEASGMDESKLSYTWYITDSGGVLWDFATSNEVYTIIGQGTPKLMIDKTGDDEITFITFSPGAKCEVRDEEGNLVEIEMEGTYPPLEL